MPGRRGAGEGSVYPGRVLGHDAHPRTDPVGTPRAYLVYFPSLALLLTVLCVNFLGDGLRDALGPQSGRE